ATAPSHLVSRGRCIGWLLPLLRCYTVSDLGPGPQRLILAHHGVGCSQEKPPPSGAQRDVTGVGPGLQRASWRRRCRDGLGGVSPGFDTAADPCYAFSVAPGPHLGED